MAGLRLFFPSRLSEPSCLEEGVGDHCHESVSMPPGLEMVEAEFLLESLMRLFADPTRLDGAGDVLDRRVGRKVRQIVFPFAAGAMLAHQPILFHRQPPSKLAPYESRIPQTGNPQNHTPAKVVLAVLLHAACT